MSSFSRGGMVEISRQERGDVWDGNMKKTRRIGNNDACLGVSNSDFISGSDSISIVTSILSFFFPGIHFTSSSISLSPERPRTSLSAFLFCWILQDRLKHITLKKSLTSSTTSLQFTPQFPYFAAGGGGGPLVGGFGTSEPGASETFIGGICGAVAAVVVVFGAT